MGYFGTIVLLVGLISIQTSFGAKPILKCSARLASLASQYEDAIDSMDLIAIDRQLARLRDTKPLEFDLNRFQVLRDAINETFFWVDDYDLLSDSFSALQQQEIRLLFSIAHQKEASDDLDQARTELRLLNEELYTIVSTEEAEAVLNALLEIGEKKEVVHMALTRQYENFCKSFPLESEREATQTSQPPELTQDIHSLDFATAQRARFFISRLERAMYFFESHEYPFAESYTEKWVYYLNLLKGVSTRNQAQPNALTYPNQVKTIILETAKHIQTLLFIKGIAKSPHRAQTPLYAKELLKLDALDFMTPIGKGTSFAGLTLFQVIVMLQEKQLFNAMIEVFQRREGFIENRTNLEP